MALAPPTLVNIRLGYAYDQYIGLGTQWGNPYANEMSRTLAVRKYERRLRGFLETDAAWRVDLKSLSGKILGCHCAPKPCHGDVLIKLFLEFFGPDAKIEVSGDSKCAGKNNLEGGFSGGVSLMSPLK